MAESFRVSGGGRRESAPAGHIAQSRSGYPHQLHDIQSESCPILFNQVRVPLAAMMICLERSKWTSTTTVLGSLAITASILVRTNFLNRIFRRRGLATFQHNQEWC